MSKPVIVILIVTVIGGFLGIYFGAAHYVLNSTRYNLAP